MTNIERASAFTGQPDLSLIICTLNEGAAIRSVVTEISDTLAGISHEIIVVDDNSADNTAAEVLDLARTHPHVRLHVRLNERGLSSAAIKGWDIAYGKYLGVMDGDGQHDPKAIRAARSELTQNGPFDLAAAGATLIDGSTDIDISLEDSDMNANPPLSLTKRYLWPEEGLRRIPDWVYTDQTIYEREIDKIFHGRTWNYVALECEVPNAGESVRLSLIGSTRVGGRYEDGSAFATAELTAAIEAVARDMPQFHVGRFDVRYRTLQDLRCGRFTIMEVNGAGSEAVHAWDPKYSVRQVYRMVFAKQRLLFALGAANRARGHRPIGMLALARHHLHQQRLIRRYPPSN